MKPIKAVILEFEFEDGTTMSHRRFTRDGEIIIADMVKELYRLCNRDEDLEEGTRCCFCPPEQIEGC